LKTYAWISVDEYCRLQIGCWTFAASKLLQNEESKTSLMKKNYTAAFTATPSVKN
jgi:hypothetical protein